MEDVVRVSVDGPIAVVTLNRPKAFNAFNLEMMGELADRLIGVGADDAVRGVVITGAGKAFCGGGDLKYVLEFPGGVYAAFMALAAQFNRAVTEIRNMGKPVVAAVNGVAAGGGFSLALACDFRVMGASARLIQGYRSRALEIATFDKPIGAQQALSWGLATKVAEDGGVVAGATELAAEAAARPRRSFAWSKRLVNESFDTPFSTHIEREREGLAVCGSSEDGIEGLRSFVEKRAPKFKL